MSCDLTWPAWFRGEPGWLLSMGSHRVGHDWSDLAAAAAWFLREIPCRLNYVPLVAKASFLWLCSIFFSLHLGLRSLIISVLEAIWAHPVWGAQLLGSFGLCCCSVTKSGPTLCDPMDCCTPGFLVLQCLPEFAQTHVHWVGDAIQPSHRLSPLSPPALNLSQHQGLFQWVGFWHQVAKELEL